MADTTLPALGFAPRPLRRAGEPAGAPPSAHAARRRSAWVAGCALVAALIGLAAIVGWLTGVWGLLTPRRDWPALEPASAVGYLLCAAALWLLHRPGASFRHRASGRLLASLALVTGVVTLVQTLYGFDLFDDNGVQGVVAGRMAPSTAVGLMFVGGALLLLDTETRAGRRPAELLAASVLVMSVPRLVGYAYGVVPHTRMLVEPAVMSTYGAIALSALAVGVLAARADRGLVSIFSSTTIAGRAVRRFVPAAGLIPLLLGALGVAAAAGGIIDTLYVAPLVVSGVVVCFTGLSLLAADSARRADAQRENTMQRLQAQHAATRALVESTTVSEASRRFLESIGDVLDWDFAALWQADHRAQLLRCAHVWHRPGVDVSDFEDFTAGMTLAPGVELPGLVWLSRKPEWIPDIQRSPSLRGAAAGRCGLRAGFAFPVRYGPETWGVIEFFSRVVRDPDADLVALAPVLGGQMGEAIERKRAEELLRASEDRFRAVAETASDALITVDGAGTVTYANPAAERMFGATAAELVGKPRSALLPGLGAAGPPPAAGSLESVGRRADGGELPVELSAATWSTAEGAFSTAIIRDISARKRVEQELRRARDAAEASSRELEAFSYSVSHDLRAPVRSIDGFTQAVLEDVADRLRPEERDNLQRVRAAAEKMSQLIDDLLELSRTSRADLHHEEIDLTALAQEVVAELRAATPERQAEVHIAEGMAAWGDARLLRVVLGNLLDNAWKFTGRLEEAQIEVGVEDEREPPVYFVRDDGIGFDMAFEAKLFTPFQRLHDEADFPGTGVGLALVQRIVRRHGGRIWAESHVGAGATFYFTLPDAPDPAGGALDSAGTAQAES